MNVAENRSERSHAHGRRHGGLGVPETRSGVFDMPLVSRVVSDFTVSFWDNRVCLLLRRSCCVPVMSRD